MDRGNLSQSESPEPFVPIELRCLKQKINDLLWAYGQPDLTLGQAENAACAVFDILEPVTRINRKDGD